MIVFLMGLFGFVASISTLMVNWLKDEQLLSFRKSVEAAYQSDNEMDVVRWPATIALSMVGILLDERTFSWSTTKKVLLTSIVVLLGSLFIAGSYSGNAFAIETMPWDAYVETIDGYEETLEQICSDQEPSSTTTVERDYRLSGADCVDLRERVQSAQGAHWKWVYTVVLVVLVFGVNYLADLCSLMMARKTLRAIIELESPWLSLPTLIVWMIGAFVIFFTVAFGITVLANPTLLAVPSVGASVGSTVFGWLATGALAWWLFASPWVYAASMSAVVPSIGFLTATTLFLALYPIRLTIKRFVNHSLERALAHERGPIAFVGATALGVVGLLAILLQLTS